MPVVFQTLTDRFRDLYLDPEFNASASGSYRPDRPEGSAMGLAKQLDPELPVLFLDIDDVLCLNQTYSCYDVSKALYGRHELPHAVFASVFEPRARDILRRVHDGLDGKLRYVISSAWREHFTRKEMAEVLTRGGLGFVAQGFHARWRTPILGWWPPQRLKEIAAWLEPHDKGLAFAVLDDMSSGHSLKPALTQSSHPFHGRVVLCEENVGLCEEHLAPLLAALIGQRAQPARPPGGKP